MTNALAYFAAIKETKKKDFDDWLEVDGVGGKIENDGQQKETDSGADPVKTFYGRNLQVFVIQMSKQVREFVPGKPFQPSLMLEGKTRACPLEWSLRKVLHLGRLLPYKNP